MPTILWYDVEVNWFDWNARFEGVVEHFYADIRGLVTIGVGNLVDPVSLALALPMRRLSDKALASPAEIKAEWLRVKNDPDAARLGPWNKKTATWLYLPSTDIRALVDEKLQQVASSLCERFPALPDMPADVQVVLCSMAWAMGTGFPRKFPKFSACIDRQDWKGAAEECKIRESDNPGVKGRNRANRAHLLAAAEGCGEHHELTRDP
jgi:GH24 family phage-related lysozyme (muramidase)